MNQYLGELARRMGVEILRADYDEVVLRLPVAGNRQPVGLLHGGANAVLVMPPRFSRFSTLQMARPPSAPN